MKAKLQRKNKKGEVLLEVINQAVDNPKETDEQIMTRLRDRFEILTEMTQASIEGVVRGMVVTGPPGVGKSFGVEEVLEKNNLFDKLAGNKLRFAIEKGAASAIGLYKLLYTYSDKSNVLVLDDCDTAVSYTHLRAHETLLDLVCRLLLEKNFFLMIRRPPRSTLTTSSAASDVYKRQQL